LKKTRRKLLALEIVAVPMPTFQFGKRFLFLFFKLMLFLFSRILVPEDHST